MSLALAGRGTLSSSYAVTPQSILTLWISLVALRAVKKHTVGHTLAEARVLTATENSPKNGSPFVPLSLRHEIAELSWDE